MSTHWYALRCKPHMEACVAGQLGFHQIVYFYPTCQVRPVNPRSQKTKPYFPGYLFVRLSPGATGSAIIKWMPGAVGLVCFDHTPASVPDSMIAAIRQHVAKLDSSERTSDRFQQGDAVEVVGGALTGSRGIFDLNLNDRQRARVLLKMLGENYMRVELPVGFIEPIKQS